MNIRKYIPNTITCLNLVSGCIASVMAFEGNLLFALLWIVAAAVFDFFDGLAARALKAYSPMGKELDSLADVVSFGVAPGMILFTSLRIWASSSSAGCLSEYIPYIAFVVPAFSGLSLAKFNIAERQTTSFIGLPVPAHALLWSSAAYSLQEWLLSGQTWVVVVMIAAFCATSYLLVSEVPMFSLKIKSLSWKGNELRYILIIASALLIISFGFIGISGAILLYILLSVIGGKK